MIGLLVMISVVVFVFIYFWSVPTLVKHEGTRAKYLAVKHYLKKNWLKKQF
jgi:hypothetical protein